MPDITYRTNFRDVTDYVDVVGEPVWDGKHIYGEPTPIAVSALRIRHLIDRESNVAQVHVIGHYLTKNGKPGKRRADVYAGTRERWTPWITAIVDAHPIGTYPAADATLTLPED